MEGLHPAFTKGRMKPTTKPEFRGFRGVSGYSGHRRLESQDFSVGTVLGGPTVVPSKVRKALAAGHADLVESFEHHDEDGSGGLDRDEFRRIFEHAGVTMSIEDTDALFDSIDTSHDGIIQQDEFQAYMKSANIGSYDVQPEKREFAGSRPVGYAGHRRKQSYYDNVGRSSANKVSGKTKQAIFDKVNSIDELFDQLDTNHDGILSQEECRVGFAAMNLGLNQQQIDSIFVELSAQSPRPDGKIIREALRKWLQQTGKDFVVVSHPPKSMGPQEIKQFAPDPSTFNHVNQSYAARQKAMESKIFKKSKPIHRVGRDVLLKRRVELYAGPNVARFNNNRESVSGVVMQGLASPWTTSSGAASLTVSRAIATDYNREVGLPSHLTQRSRSPTKMAWGATAAPAKSLRPDHMKWKTTYERMSMPEPVAVGNASFTGSRYY